MQRALLGIAGDRARHGLGLFGLLGDHDLLGRGHHGADGSGLGQGLAAALFEVGRTCGFFLRTGAGFGFGLLAGFGLRGGTGGRFSGLLAAGFLLDRRSLGLLFGLLGSVGGSALSGFAFAAFALAALRGQFGFLAADQLGLAACFFLAAGQFLVLCRVRCLLCLCRIASTVVPCGSVDSVVTFDEGALLAHFDLDGAGLARGIGLLDLAGGLFHQRDFLAIPGRAMAGLQVR